MNPRRFYLLCDDYDHAFAVDQLVLHRLTVEFGIRANAWSEVYSDGERFGIYWGDPVSSLFGHPPSVEHPDGDPALVIVEDAEGVWQVVRPTEDPDAGAI